MDGNLVSAQKGKAKGKPMSDIVADIRNGRAASRIAGEFMDSIGRAAGQRRDE